jgi:nitrate/nitrite transport system ATP-binding protein
LLKNPEFKTLKLKLINTLLDAKKSSAPKAVKKLSPPDILPEDLGVKRNFGLARRAEPRRRSQLHKEEIPIS